MKWGLGILLIITVPYFAYVFFCYVYWNLKVVHHYSDAEEEMFLTGNGNVYWGKLSLKGLLFTRPSCVRKNLQWRELTKDQMDSLIYDQCIDDHLDLLGPRSYEWMEESKYERKS